MPGVRLVILPSPLASRSVAEVQRLARATGFVCVEQWVDAEWPFAENLLTVGSP